MADDIIFKKGKFSNLPSEKQNGTVYFAEDDTDGHIINGYIYYDLIKKETQEGKEIEVGYRLPINGHGYHLEYSEDEEKEFLRFNQPIALLNNNERWFEIGEDAWKMRFTINKFEDSTGNETNNIGLLHIKDKDTKNWILKIDKLGYPYLGSADPENCIEIRPETTDKYSLGGPSNKWTSLYLSNFTINSTGTLSNSLLPNSSGYGLGDSTYKWKDLYLNNFTIEADGSIANDLVPASKSTYALGNLFYTWDGLYLDGFTIDGDGNINNDLTPFNATYNLGNLTHKWGGLYLSNFTIDSGMIHNSLLPKETTTTTNPETGEQTQTATHYSLGAPAAKWDELHLTNFTIVADGRIINDLLPFSLVKDPDTGELQPPIYTLGNSTYKWDGLYLDGFTIDTDGRITNDLLPTTSNAYALGNSTYKWNGLFLNGFTIYSDGSINNSLLPTINSTYTLGDLTYKWNGLYLNGFTIESDGSINNNLLPSLTTSYTLGSSTYKWDGLYLDGFTIDTGGGIANNLLPGTTTSYTLGSSTYKWDGLYLDGFTIDTSGRITNALLPSATTSYALGSSGLKWNGLYLNGFTINSSGRIANNLLPSATTSYTLGSSGLKWNGLYLNGFTIDSDGRVVNNLLPSATETYKLGSSKLKWQTIYTKSIDTDNIEVDNGLGYISVTSGEGLVTLMSNGTSAILLDKNTTIIKGQMHFGLEDGDSFFITNWKNKAGDVHEAIAYHGSKRGTLGGPSAKWHSVYCSGTYSTGEGLISDKRFKDIIQDETILRKDLVLYDSLEPVCYKYKNILPDDDYSRTHIGFLAQDIEKRIEEVGLTSEECALVWADPIAEDSSEELKNVCTDGYQYYLNYNELHGLHTLKNHQQDARLTALEIKNQELENTISELKTQIELFKLAIGG